jgi:hypothetical protein
MINNSTNINKTDNNLSLQLTKHKKWLQHKMFEIQVLAWDRHKKCGEVKPVNGSQCSSWICQSDLNVI